MAKIPLPIFNFPLFSILLLNVIILSEVTYNIRSHTFSMSSFFLYSNSTCQSLIQVLVSAKVSTFVPHCTTGLCKSYMLAKCCLHGHWYHIQSGMKLTHAKCLVLLYDQVLHNFIFNLFYVFYMAYFILYSTVSPFTNLLVLLSCTPLISLPIAPCYSSLFSSLSDPAHLLHCD